jgi:hypothetical protein
MTNKKLMAESQTLATKLLESEKIAKSRMDRVAGFLSIYHSYRILPLDSKPLR